jgi:hypothetical protein
MLRDTHDGAKTLRRVRTLKVDKSIEKYLFRDQRHRNHCKACGQTRPISGTGG